MEGIPTWSHAAVSGWFPPAFCCTAAAATRAAVCIPIRLCTFLCWLAVGRMICATSQPPHTCQATLFSLVTSLDADRHLVATVSESFCHLALSFNFETGNATSGHDDQYTVSTSYPPILGTLKPLVASPGPPEVCVMPTRHLQVEIYFPSMVTPSYAAPRPFQLKPPVPPQPWSQVFIGGAKASSSPWSWFGDNPIDGCRAVRVAVRCYLHQHHRAAARASCIHSSLHTSYIHISTPHTVLVKEAEHMLSIPSFHHESCDGECKWGAKILA